MNIVVIVVFLRGEMGLPYYFLGDLKLVEKPQPILLGPNDFSSIKVKHIVLQSSFSILILRDLSILINSVMFPLSIEVNFYNCLVVPKYFK